MALCHECCHGCATVTHESSHARAPNLAVKWPPNEYVPSIWFKYCLREIMRQGKRSAVSMSIISLVISCRWLIAYLSWHPTGTSPDYLPSPGAFNTWRNLGNKQQHLEHHLHEDFLCFRFFEALQLQSDALPWHSESLWLLDTTDSENAVRHPSGIIDGSLLVTCCH